ncbi:MAG: sugar ABC transporter substrate-binding protein [Propionibacteriaceae bacterium]
MSIKIIERGFSRRGILRASTTALATLAVGGLAGCKPSSGSGGGAKTSSELALQTYKEFTGVKPDLAGSAAGLQPGFLSMPKAFVTGSKGKPLSAPVTGLTETFDVPSPAMKSNPYWQRLNAKLGGDLDLIIAQDVGAGYPEKFATILASNDLPDLMWIPPNQGIPNVGPMLEATFTDLTSHLSGDAVLEYPNLAALKPASWKTAVVNGKIWGAPIPSTPMGQCMVANPAVWEKVGGFQSTSADEFLDKAKQISKNNVYALEPSYINMVHMFGEWFKVPNRWRVNADRTLTYYLETDAYKAAMEFAAKVFAAGCFHPNPNLPDARPLVATGQIGAYVDVGPSTGALRRYKPDVQAEVLIPFGADGTSEPSYDLGYGTVGFTAFKQADEGRIKQLLALIDWLSAPFGTTEWVDKNYGTEGADWMRDTKTGDLLQTKSAQTNAPGLVSALVIMSNCESVIYNSGHPEDTRSQYEAEQKLLKFAMAIPTSGTYSDTDAKVGAKISTEARDKMVDIVTGRAKIDSWDAAVKRWRDSGGDKMREEYQAVLPADVPVTR